MFQVIFNLKDFFKQYKKNYLIAFITMILSNLLRVLLPYIVGLIIDYMLNDTLTSNLLERLVTIFIVSTIGSYLFEFIWSYFLFTGAAHLQRNLRKDLMDHFLKRRAIFYEKFRVGDIMARSTQDVRSIAQTAGFGMMILMDSTIFLITIVLVMGFTVSWSLTFFSMLPLIILAYLFGKVGNMVEKRYSISQEAFSSLNNDVLEVVDGIRVIRAYVKEEAYVDKFRKQTESLLEKNNKVAEANALFMPAVKLFTSITIVISFGYGAYLVYNGQLSVGDIVAYQMYLAMLVWPIISIGELTNVLRQGNASMERVEFLLSTKDDMEKDGSHTVEKTGNVVMEDFNFQYPSSTTRNLKNLQFTVPKGKLVGIVGKTGAGKTTLLRQLLRQYPLGEGMVEYNNRSLLDYQRKEFQGLIGYVPQDHILFSRSVRENILFGKPEASEEEIVDSIRIASFEEDLKHMEEGIDTLVGEKGVSISGGQKQRISLARAIIKDPEILILDDSLSAVDAKTEQNIIQNIQQNRADKTTIISTHRLSAIKEADEIVVLEDGEIVERGTHEELMNEQGWYYEQYIRQELREGDEE